MPIFPIERYLAIVVNGTNKFVATPLDEASMRTIALLTADNGQNWRLCLPKNISEEKFEIINKRGRKRRNSLKEKTKNYKLIIKCAHRKWIHLSFMFCLCANAHILTIHSIEPQNQWTKMHAVNHSTFFANANAIWLAMIFDGMRPFAQSWLDSDTNQKPKAHQIIMCKQTSEKRARERFTCQNFGCQLWRKTIMMCQYIQPCHGEVKICHGSNEIYSFNAYNDKWQIDNSSGLSVSATNIEIVMLSFSLGSRLRPTK